MAHFAKHVIPHPGPEIRDDPFAFLAVPALADIAVPARDPDLRVRSILVIDDAPLIGETSGLVGPIRSIDVLTEDPNAPGDKIIALMAIYKANRGGALESGVFRVDAATGTAGRLFERDWLTSSMSFLRDPSGNLQAIN